MTNALMMACLGSWLAISGWVLIRWTGSPNTLVAANLLPVAALIWLGIWQMLANALAPEALGLAAKNASVFSIVVLNAVLLLFGWMATACVIYAVGPRVDDDLRGGLALLGGVSATAILTVPYRPLLLAMDVVALTLLPLQFALGATYAWVSSSSPIFRRFGGRG